MQHTLVAVFDDRSDAQNAMNELISSGFSRQEVKLSNADPTGMTDSITGNAGHTDTSTGASDTLADGTGAGIGANIKRFFTDLFGADHSEQASRYEGAVTRGHHVLTLRADSLPEVERAADIIERYGPTDIDEHASGSGADDADAGLGAMGGAGARSESMRMSGAGGMQQSGQMSAQSGRDGGRDGGRDAGRDAGPGSGASLTGTSTGASTGLGMGSSHQLENAGDRNLFQQQSLNQAEPMGTTYQEPQGHSGLTATGGTSLHGSTLQENAIQGSSLDGTQRDRGLSAGGAQGAALQGSSLEGSAVQGGGGSMQRDTAMGGSTPATRYAETQRGKSRIYSPTTDTGSDRSFDSGGGSFLDAGGHASDDDYRRHFAANYSGEEYDRVKPAYAYGSEMASNDKYRGRKWDEVENDLRTDWDTRYGDTHGGTWEKMKAAVRRGWDRMTGDDDDDYYRSHYDTHLSNTGRDYDSVKPAYSYGSEMRKSDLYRNRPWDDIEGDMRRGWDSRISADGTDSSTSASDTTMGGAVGDTWDQMKAAVRHGWDRMTDDDDDREYRKHWDATYRNQNDPGSYHDFKPAYAYGTAMARDEKYRGRQWNDVENDLHRDWDTRYGSNERSTWDKVKSAVRHGWDRISS